MPAICKETEIFVDPISYVINFARVPVHYNDVAPPWCKLVASDIEGYPEMQEFHDPAIRAVDAV